MERVGVTNMESYIRGVTEGVQEATEVGTTHLGALGGPGAPWWVVPPSGHPPGAALAQ